MLLIIKKLSKNLTLQNNILKVKLTQKKNITIKYLELKDIEIPFEISTVNDFGLLDLIYNNQLYNITLDDELAKKGIMIVYKKIQNNILHIKLISFNPESISIPAKTNIIDISFFKPQNIDLRYIKE